ncbi:hypothetical protein PRVXH_001592 [Proteinivorax hydrogeniformans]|uniref:Uncharacterized protein n=1 Tax=Proteinivorax hydrogeniformans TaxID=1826727 RepID=A0AAU8HPY4_9FIRM
MEVAWEETKIETIDDLMPLLMKHEKWKEVNLYVFNEIFCNCNHDVAKVKDFLLLSDFYELVENNFVAISESEKDVKMILSMFGLTLFRLGEDILNSIKLSDLLKRDNREKLAVAEVSFRSSLICDPFIIQSYKGAILCAVLFDDQKYIDSYKNEFKRHIEKSKVEQLGSLSYLQRAYLEENEEQREVKTIIYKLINYPHHIHKAIKILDEIKERFSEYSYAFELVNNQVDDLIRERLSEYIDMINNGTDTRMWIYGLVSNIAGDYAESGRYHLHRGVLNPVGRDLLKIYDGTVDYLSDMKFICIKNAILQKKQIRKNIENIG